MSDKEKKDTKGVKLSPKAVLILLIIVLAIVGICLGIHAYSKYKDNGARYALALGEQIGVSPSTAEKYAKVTLDTVSENACVNMVAEEYSYLYESKKTVEVSGVSIPAWVIYCQTSNNVLTQVYYYNYRQLKTYGQGIKTSAYIDPSGITLGMTSEEVCTYIGFEPLCTAYTVGSVTETYQYYYKDKNTGNTVSYRVTVSYTDDVVTAVGDEENYFILSVLTLD